MPSGDGDVARDRVAWWARRAVDDDWERFLERLHLDGHQVPRLAELLGPVQLADPGSLPSWALVLGEVLVAAERSATDQRREPSARSSPRLPFEEALDPFVEVAAERLRPLLDEGGAGRIGPSARAAMERELLSWLSTLVSQVLVHEFAVYRLQQGSLLDRLDTAAAPHDRALYDAFVAHLLAEGGWASVLDDYAALARLLGTAVERWIERTLELEERLAEDREALVRTFGDLGDLVNVRPLSADRHRGGRTVLQLTFASGRELVYKPRPLDLEVAFGDLVAWFGGRGLSLSLRTPEALAREDHGWVALVRKRPCPDEAALRRFHHRAGMLLALVYVGNGIDCHRENLIADGEHPVLVDLESIFYPEAVEGTDPQGVQVLGPAAGGDALSSSPGRRDRSVLRTDLLPHPRAAYEEEIAAITDDPACVVDGFDEMYRLLVRHREELAASPVWRAFADRPVRYLPRSTSTYQNLMLSSLAPRALRTGVDRDIELDVLSRAVLGDGSERRLWPLVRAEQQALRGGDIPYFSTTTGSTSLPVDSQETIAELFGETGFAAATANLRRLGEQDRRVQVRLIEEALHGDGDGRPHRG